MVGGRGISIIITIMDAVALACAILDVAWDGTLMETLPSCIDQVYYILV